MTKKKGVDSGYLFTDSLTYSIKYLLNYLGVNTDVSMLDRTENIESNNQVPPVVIEANPSESQTSV